MNMVAPLTVAMTLGLTDLMFKFAKKHRKGSRNVVWKTFLISNVAGQSILAYKYSGGKEGEKFYNNTRAKFYRIFDKVISHSEQVEDIAEIGKYVG